MPPEILNESRSGFDYLKKDNAAKKACFIFHGYGASMHDLFGLNDVVANHHEFDWYFPNAPISLLPTSKMSQAWFPINMAALEAAMMKGEHRDLALEAPVELETALAGSLTFIESLSDKYEEIIIGGFSQGAMLCSHLALRTKLKIKALICFSGSLLAYEKLKSLDHENQSISFFQSHGTSDPLLAYEQAKKLFELLKLEGMQGEFVSFDGAHEIPMEVIQKWSGFMQRLSSNI